MVREVTSLKSLQDELKAADKSFLLLYKKNADVSECALNAFIKASSPNDAIKTLCVDVSQIRDIHPVYDINSVPTLIEFDRERPKNVIKGCQTEAYYQSLLKKNFFAAEKAQEAKPQKRVTVYSTPTCSWCTTLKRYFDENGVKYTDIDVSKDQKRAEEMVKRSGQQGVPQTDINGTMIVGFDKNRINILLGITN